MSSGVCGEVAWHSEVHAAELAAIAAPLLLWHVVLVE